MGPSIGRCVASWKQIDAQVRVVRFFREVLRQPPPNLPGSDPDDWVRRGVVGWLAGEDVDPERPFLQRLRRVGQGMFDDVLEEMAAALAGPKERTLGETLQLSTYLIGCRNRRGICCGQSRLFQPGPVRS